MDRHRIDQFWKECNVGDRVYIMSLVGKYFRVYNNEMRKRPVNNPMFFDKDMGYKPKKIIVAT